MKLSLIFIALFIGQLKGFSQNQDNILAGEVVNSFTYEGIWDTKVELMTSDSILIDSVRVHNGMQNNIREAVFWIPINNPGNYIIRCTHPDYETTHKNIEIKKLKKNESVSVETILMNKKRRKHIDKEIGLEEVVIKATKVKFYHKGDTLVYNADAFNLAEGSMLDALIKQLPGVELKSDGQILVNGRYVESILLNGTDFFNNNRKMMLENLPAYMVKNVKVYEKESLQNMIAGRKIDDPIYVMDVKLKREYEIGWLANAEGGIGTDSRFLLRLFTMRFTKQSRVAMFSNINNINDNRTPGQNGEWTPANIPQGLSTTRTIGSDYQILDKKGRWKINGNATFQSINSNNQVLTNSENFINDENTFGRAFNFSEGKKYSFQTNNTIQLTSIKPLSAFRFVILYPYIKYHYQNNRKKSTSGVFNIDPSAYASSRNLIDSLRLPITSSGSLHQMLVNRTLNDSYLKGIQLEIGSTYDLFIKVPNTNKFIMAKGGISYHYDKQKNYEHLNWDFMSNNNTSMYQNRFIDTPSENLEFNTKIGYYSWDIISKPREETFSIIPYYKIQMTQKSHERGFYRLDNLENWGENTIHPLGELPSVTLMKEVLERNNSFHSKSNDYQNELAIESDYQLMDFGKNKNKGIRFRFTLPMSVISEKLSYNRGDIDTLMRRTALVFQPNIQIDYEFSRKNQGYTVGNSGAPLISFNYNMKQLLPKQSEMIDIKDNTDPLYIRYGNHNLHRAITHNLQLAFRKENNSRMLNASMAYNITENALAVSSIYDSETGIQYIKPENINGNWSGNANVGYTMPLDEKRRWTLQTNTNGTFHHSVDLMTIIGNQSNPRSSVNTLNINETINLSCRLNEKIFWGLRGRGTWINATSKQNNFSPINAVDFDVSFTANATLPANIKLDTDLTQYFRRGYTDKAMNSNELIWNARLSKSFMKGNLTVMIDGLDILGQLKNIQRTINVQGRIESYYNTIPRYAMLHIIYRLNKEPKKK